MSKRIIKSTYMGERDTIGICHSFGWGKNMANGARDSSSLLSILITDFESPSRTKQLHPISKANNIARATAKASTMSKLKGRGIYSDNETMTWHWLSWITTPRPALHISLNIASSKLTFKEFGGGGDHLIHGCMWAAT